MISDEDIQQHYDAYIQLVASYERDSMSANEKIKNHAISMLEILRFSEFIKGKFKVNE